MSNECQLCQAQAKLCIKSSQELCISSLIRKLRCEQVKCLAQDHMPELAGLAKGAWVEVTCLHE